MKIRYIQMNLIFKSKTNPAYFMQIENIFSSHASEYDEVHAIN